MSSGGTKEQRAAFVERLLAEQRLAIKSAEEKLRELQQIEQNYLQLKERLTTLPARLSHPVTVPLNSVGFFLGSLIHTNEITVLLSSEILVQVSASKALEILHKRVGECRSRQDKAREEIKHFNQWKKFTSSEGAQSGENAEEGVDINEEFDEDREAEWREQHAERVRKERARERTEMKRAAESTDESALWQRLEELEMEEELTNYEDLKQTQRISIEKTSTSEIPLRLSEEDASKDIVMNRSSLSTEEVASSSGKSPRSILRRRPSDGSLKSVHFHNDIKDIQQTLDSDDDEDPPVEDEQPEEDAFTGVILERSSETGDIIDPPVTSQPKRVSRFKASRS